MQDLMIMIFQDLKGTEISKIFLNDTILDYNVKDSNGNNFLIVASNLGKTNLVNLLLEKKVIDDIDYQNYEGNTAMMEALCHEHFDIVNILLDNTANPYIFNRKNDNVAQIIERKKYKDLKERLKINFLKRFCFLLCCNQSNYEDSEDD
jgi:ankyrin repeat protein